jgi:hypothetical protein
VAQIHHELTGAGQPGLEPGTSGFGDRRYHQLSYCPGAAIVAPDVRSNREHVFVYVAHEATTIERVRTLCSDGVSLAEISRRTGVARGTIRQWRERGFEPLPPASTAWIATDNYVYVLGLYLGDGSLSLPGRSRSHTLDIACDALYDAILNEATRALECVFPHALVRRLRQPDSRCVHLRITHAAVLSAFPQHGPGRKHERSIELTGWQRVLTQRYPQVFIRGLIHSDGARCINQVNTTLPSGRKAHYEYVRYFFTNYSADIRRIFCEHCDLLGIRWTQSSHRNISISHRESTAILDRIVGPKT